MRVQIDSRYPVSMSVDADDFGKLFASMNSEEQVAVIQSVFDYMIFHQTQWDYIAIELEKEENATLLRNIKSTIAGMFAQ